jgi:hypothetical protein
MIRAGSITSALLLIVMVTGAVAQESPRARNPHGNLDLDCNLCHSEGSWQKVEVTEGFDHSATGFQLEGRHAQVQCRDCHRDPRFAFVGTACADCHADIHKGRLGPDCNECHTPADWVDRGEQRRQHDTTSFPLVGAHDRVDCDACHTGPVAGDYAGTPIDCYFCHADSWAATTNPDHEAVGFGHDCVTCHSPYSSTFGRGDFVHPANFPLTGGHRSLDCAECHTGGFGGAVSDCYSCHQDDYEGTNDPNHIAAGFPVSCSICHSTTSFEPAQYTHDSTGFPLTGAHRGLDCLSCHQDGYTNTPNDCYSCHQTEYQQTTNPDHTASDFPTSCAVCHSTTAWTPADFDHNTTGFALTGAHSTVDCLACHQSGYVGTPSDCFACHQDDYNGTTNPNHLASGFPNTCADCHGTSAWEPADWDHDSLFPINSGKHREEWNSCADCHVVSSNYSVFECIFCHEHNQTDMDRKHNDENGYVYQSTACFECHPRGVADD